MELVMLALFYPIFLKKEVSLLKIKIDGETYYSAKSFADQVEKSYSHIRHLSSDAQSNAVKLKEDFQPHVRREEGRVYIHEDALDLF